MMEKKLSLFRVSRILFKVLLLTTTTNCAVFELLHQCVPLVWFLFPLNFDLMPSESKHTHTHTRIINTTANHYIVWTVKIQTKTGEKKTDDDDDKKAMCLLCKCRSIKAYFDSVLSLPAWLCCFFLFFKCGNQIHFDDVWVCVCNVLLLLCWRDMCFMRLMRSEILKKTPIETIYPPLPKCA